MSIWLQWQVAEALLVGVAGGDGWTGETTVETYQPHFHQNTLIRFIIGLGFTREGVG
jgi:hypothetical protein